jgi:hypothetical protein
MLMDEFLERGSKAAQRKIKKAKFEGWFEKYKEEQVENHIGSIYDV